MSVLRAFRKRPPYPIPSPSLPDNLPCFPCITQRGTHPTHYPEFFMFPGPQTLAVTGDNSYDTLFGRTWAILFCDDETFHVLQWTGEGETPPEGLETGGWHVVEDPLLTLPEFTGAERAFTGAFDQSARLIIAYELDGVIRVTRWDSDAGAYVQNVTFDGRDPTLLMDASITWRVPDSDVILFYTSGDRQSLHYRVQRETYGIARPLMWGDAETAVEYPDGVILDYAQAIPYRYELLIAEPTGAKPPLALVSDLYPIPQRDRLVGAGVPALGAHRQTTVLHVDENRIDASGAPGVGLYSRTITSHEGSVALSGDAVPALGAYTRMITSHEASEDLSGGGIPALGTYERTIFDTTGSESLAGGAVPGTGAYRAAS